MMAITLLFVSPGCALRQPIMVLPEALQGDADVLPVSGRQGFGWQRDLRFGQFRTAHTNWVWRSDDSNNWGVLDQNATWSAKRPVSFVLEGTGCEPWTARCLGHASTGHREKAIGVGVDERGLGIRREIVEDTTSEQFECDLVSSAGRKWNFQMARDVHSGFGGVILDERASEVARVHATDQQTGKPYTYVAPQPLGFVIDTSAGVVVGVERAFDGKVVLSRATVSSQVCPLATVAAALLLWEPLR